MAPDITYKCKGRAMGQGQKILKIQVLHLTADYNDEESIIM
jgi:hypothetical protein